MGLLLASLNKSQVTIYFISLFLKYEILVLVATSKKFPQLEFVYKNISPGPVVFLPDMSKSETVYVE